ncbi:glutamate--tRNA ligase [Candidatus Parcubacteria bacterium]|jgi:glutamyl-tRNA synthetase|nr:MAG: glutamate--tRNA ligase [Candidatus Parcubacteria bacterium]
MKSEIRVRFAPSPTGSLHIGGLRTALYNFLFARKNHGAFILRIEDTDQKRSVLGGVEEIIKTLNAFGLKYDEGPILKNGRLDEKGDSGPYVQSKRLKFYQEAASKLVAKNFAYPCFCTVERLEDIRKQQVQKNLPPGYDGFCRDLPSAESQERVKKGEKHIIRFKMPKTGQTDADDLIRGKVSFKHIFLEDAVLLKADGFPTYHLANVVDDHAMAISHVIRAEEWLPSLPLHIQLYQALNWPMPEFAHLPLILGPNRKKLSKRDNDTAAKDYLKDYLPNAILNFIALLGWNPKTNQEFYPSPENLAADFDLKKINRAGAIFELKKLIYLNRQHLRAQDPIVLAEKVGLGLSPAECQKFLPLALDRAEKLSDIPKSINFLLTDEINYSKDLLMPKHINSETAVKENLTLIHDFLKEIPQTAWNNQGDFKNNILAWIKSQNKTNAEMLWPFRVALSGLEKSPDPFEIAVALGKKKTLQRVEKGIAKF